MVFDNNQLLVLKRIDEFFFLYIKIGINFHWFIGLLIKKVEIIIIVYNF